MSSSKWFMPTSWKRMELDELSGRSMGRLLTPQPKVLLPLGSISKPAHLLQPAQRILAVQWVALDLEDPKTVVVVPL